MFQQQLIVQVCSERSITHFNLEMEHQTDCSLHKAQLAVSEREVQLRMNCRINYVSHQLMMNVNSIQGIDSNNWAVKELAKHDRDTLHHQLSYHDIELLFCSLL